MVKNREQADDETIAAQVAGAGLIYLSGGDPQVLAATLRDTALWRAIVAAWQNGAALAGCSAGAMALGDRVPEGADVREQIAILNRCFFREFGFAANLNDYYDPDNSHLNAVLKRRRGIPISLAVLYLELAGQLGLPVQGVSFPGHFLLRASLPDGDAMEPNDPVVNELLKEPA